MIKPMNKIAAFLLTAIMILSITACGGGASNTTQNTADQSADNAGTLSNEETSQQAEPEATAEQKDTAEDYRFDYPEDIVLLDDDFVRITADSISYRENSESASGRRMALFLIVENKADTELTVRNRKDNSQTLNANDSAQIIYSTDEWNGWVGETEDCRQDTCQIEIEQIVDESINKREIVDAVRFDWYVSEATPFFNVISGVEEVEAAEQAAELKYLQSLDPLYHAENEIISVDIFKAEAAYSTYKVTYVATNQSDFPVYALSQADPSKGLTDYAIYADFWKYADAYEPGESWYITKEFYINSFDEGPAELSVTAYNAIRQKVAEITFVVTAPEVFPEEPTEAAELKFEDDTSFADKDLAAAYTDIGDITPFFSVENEALHLDLLATYTEYSAENDRYTGKVVYALTNTTGQELYYHNGHEMVKIASGETTYATDDTGYSDVGTAGERVGVVELMASKVDPQTAASVGYSYNWKFDPEAGEIAVSDFTVEPNKNMVNPDVLSGEALSTEIVNYNYDNIVLVETNYYRIELRSMSGKKDSSGNWTVEAELVMTNIWTDRYLDYDPQKVATEDIEYLPWIYPGDTRSMTVTFTGTGDDPESVTGSFSKSIDGYQIELELFKSAFGATLRLSKTDPVVSASVN